MAWEYWKPRTPEYYQFIRERVENGSTVGTTQAVELRCYDLEENQKVLSKRIIDLERKFRSLCAFVIFDPEEDQ